MLDTASAALSSGLVVKDVRANIFKALTRLPGLEVTERQADLGGRVGIALGVDDGTHRRDLIIDPGTGQVIGERDVVTRDLGDVKAGTVLSFTSVTTGVVDTIGAEPVR
ncbi:hypothetical protein AB0G02_35610 [Actinosynnema sp. NPDC023658]|uniref:hypothetical protein n=1 Tax=Actinosynnema sp. NPDC023658 TaxID=3155465 RepID=UPI0033C45CF7